MGGGLRSCSQTTLPYFFPGHEPEASGSPDSAVDPCSPSRPKPMVTARIGGAQGESGSPAHPGPLSWQGDQDDWVPTWATPNHTSFLPAISASDAAGTRSDKTGPFVA